MLKFAVLLTCFNRKDKTEASLKSIYSAFENVKDRFQMDIFLTDDGSTDGTGKMVSEKYPKIHILKGTGTLYWAGGMRNSWNKALEGNYDAYLLLNDDTDVEKDIFKKIIETETFCKEQNGISGVYVGATIDSKTNELTYGGSNYTNRLLGTAKRLPVIDAPQSCELGNANIMWVPKNVVDKVGILGKGYIHGMADYDYTMMAVKNNLPVYVIPGISGKCSNDHGNIYERFMKLTFRKRIQFLYSPIGLDFNSQIYHMKRHFPLRLPIFVLTGWLKVAFPKLYYRKIYSARIKPSN